MAEANPAHMLHIISDDKGHAIAKKLFETYIKQEGGDNTRLAEFLIALDRLVSEFGGRPVKNENSGGGNDDDDYGDDEDIHAETSRLVYRAVASILSKHQ